MEAAEQLPLELVGEILSWVPSKSLARFRAISKQWNTIWEDKRFLNNYFARARPQFILRTNSKIFSVDINLDLDPIIEVHDVNLDIKGTARIVHCDGFLLSDMFRKGFEVWNPWLSHKRIIENHKYKFCGLGYDNTRPKTSYKFLGLDFCLDACGKRYPKFAIYDFKSDTFKFVINPSWGQDWRVPQLDTIVSLKGNLYWISYDSKTCQHFIRSFDFSKEIFKTFCLLPCNEEEDFSYTQVLDVFRGDRFSVLRQSYMTRKVEILVTKHKIDGNGEAVAWMSFMTVQIPNFPMLYRKCVGRSLPSYFVDYNKRLFVCTCDETGHACIYIVKGDVFRKIPIDSVVDLWPSHLTYIPSLIPIPFGQR